MSDELLAFIYGMLFNIARENMSLHFNLALLLSDIPYHWFIYLIGNWTQPSHCGCVLWKTTPTQVFASPVHIHPSNFLSMTLNRLQDHNDTPPPASRSLLWFQSHLGPLAVHILPLPQTPLRLPNTERGESSRTSGALVPAENYNETASTVLSSTLPHSSTVTRTGSRLIGA